MKQYFEMALANITKHGDTDIFPPPIENPILFDKKERALELSLKLTGKLDEHLAQYPPSNCSALAQVSYTGFRWITKIDPIWNAHFLGTVAVHR